MIQSAVNSEVYDSALLLSLPFDDLFRNMDERVYVGVILFIGFFLFVYSYWNGEILTDKE